MCLGFYDKWKNICMSNISESKYIIIGYYTTIKINLQSTKCFKIT